MRLGDLVKPLGTCGGEPGNVRCDLAVVMERIDLSRSRIVCGCGSNIVYRSQLELVGKCRQK